MLHIDICPGIEISPTEDKSPDFDQNLKVCSWDYVELISTVAMTFVQATFVPTTTVHIRNISAATVLGFPQYGSSCLLMRRKVKNLSASLDVYSRESAAAIVCTPDQSAWCYGTT